MIDTKTGLRLEDTLSESFHCASLSAAHTYQTLLCCIQNSNFSLQCPEDVFLEEMDTYLQVEQSALHFQTLVVLVSSTA